MSKDKRKKDLIRVPVIPSNDRGNNTYERALFDLYSHLYWLSGRINPSYTLADIRKEIQSIINNPKYNSSDIIDPDNSVLGLLRRARYDTAKSIEEMDEELDLDISGSPCTYTRKEHKVLDFIDSAILWQQFLLQDIPENSEGSGKGGTGHDEMVSSNISHILDSPSRNLFKHPHPNLSYCNSIIHNFKQDILSDLQCKLVSVDSDGSNPIYIAFVTVNRGEGGHILVRYSRDPLKALNVVLKEAEEMLKYKR